MAILGVVMAALFSRLNGTTVSTARFAHQLNDAVFVENLNRLAVHKNSCATLFAGKTLAATEFGIISTELNVGSLAAPDFKQAKLMTTDVDAPNLLYQFQILAQSPDSIGEVSSHTLIAKVNAASQIQECHMGRVVIPVKIGSCPLGKILKGIFANGNLDCI